MHTRQQQISNIFWFWVLLS